MSLNELTDIAQAVAKQRILVQSFRIANQPSDIEERVKSDVRYMIARDMLIIMERGYQAALRQYADNPSREG